MVSLTRVTSFTWAQRDAYTRFEQSCREAAGAFGLSAGVAMDLRLGWDLGIEADQVKLPKRLSFEKPHVHFEPCAWLPVQALLAELVEQGRRTWSLMQSGRVASRARWAFSSIILRRRHRGMSRA